MRKRRFRSRVYSVHCLVVLFQRHRATGDRARGWRSSGRQYGRHPFTVIVASVDVELDPDVRADFGRGRQDSVVDRVRDRGFPLF